MFFVRSSGVFTYLLFFSLRYNNLKLPSRHRRYNNVSHRIFISFNPEKRVMVGSIFPLSPSVPRSEPYLTPSSSSYRWNYVVLVYILFFCTTISTQPTETPSPSASASSSATTSASGTATSTVTVSPSQTLLPHLFVDSDTNQPGDELGSSTITMSNDGTFILTRSKVQSGGGGNGGGSSSTRSKVSLFQRQYDNTTILMYSYKRVYDFYGKDSSFGTCTSIAGDASFIVITEPYGGNYSKNGITYIYYQNKDSLFTDDVTYSLVQYIEGIISEENRGMACTLSSDSSVLTLTSPATGRIYFYSLENNPAFRRRLQSRSEPSSHARASSRALGISLSFSFQPLGGADLPVTVSGSTKTWEYGYDIDTCSNSLYTIVSAPGIDKVFIYQLDPSYQYRPQLVQVLNGQYTTATKGSRFGTSIGISNNCRVIVIGQPGNSTIQVYNLWINQWYDTSSETVTMNNTLYPNYGAGVAINNDGSRIIVGYTLPSLSNQYGIILYRLSDGHGNNGASVITAEQRIYMTGYETDSKWTSTSSSLIVSLARDGNMFVGSNINKNLNKGEIIVQLLGTPVPTATGTATGTTTMTKTSTPSNSLSSSPSSNASHSMIILALHKEAESLLPFSEWGLVGILLVAIAILLLCFFIIRHRIENSKLSKNKKSMDRGTIDGTNSDNDGTVQLSIPSLPEPGYIGKRAIHSLRSMASSRSIQLQSTRSLSSESSNDDNSKIPASPRLPVPASSLSLNSNSGAVLSTLLDEPPFRSSLTDDDDDNNSHTDNDEKYDQVLESGILTITNPFDTSNNNSHTDDSSGVSSPTLVTKRKSFRIVSDFKSPRIPASEGSLTPRSKLDESPLTVTATVPSVPSSPILRATSTTPKSIVTTTSPSVSPTLKALTLRGIIKETVPQASPIVENYKTVDTDLQLNTYVVPIVRSPGGNVTRSSPQKSPGLKGIRSRSSSRSGNPVNGTPPLRPLTPSIMATSMVEDTLLNGADRLVLSSPKTRPNGDNPSSPIRTKIYRDI